MEWMIDTQLGRRNLTYIQRIAVVKKYEDKIRKQAKERQFEAGKLYGKNHSKDNKSFAPIGENLLSVPIHTDKELAKMAGVSEGTIPRFDVIIKSDSNLTVIFDSNHYIKK